MSRPAPRSFAQARARATYEALLGAARRVFARRGYDAAQTPEIAAEAEVSVGSFYRYFRDKRHVFVEMIGAHLAEAHREVSAELEPGRFLAGDARQAIDVALEVLHAQLRGDVELYRVYVEMALRDAEVAALQARFERMGEQVIARLLAALAPGAIPDPAAAAHVIVVTAMEVTLSRIGLRHAPAAGIEDEAVRQALREMIHRFVFPGEAPLLAAGPGGEAAEAPAPRRKTARRKASARRPAVKKRRRA